MYYFIEQSQCNLLVASMKESKISKGVCCGRRLHAWLKQSFVGFMEFYASV